MPGFGVSGRALAAVTATKGEQIGETALPQRTHLGHKVNPERHERGGHRGFVRLGRSNVLSHSLLPLLAPTRQLRKCVSRLVYYFLPFLHLVLYAVLLKLGIIGEELGQPRGSHAEDSRTSRG